MNETIVPISFEEALKRKLKIIFTRHAKERLEEIQLDVREAIDYVVRAKQIEVPHNKYKQEKYGDSQNGIIYVQYKSNVFVLKIVKNNLPPHNDIILIITAIDQRLNKPSKYSNRQKLMRKKALGADGLNGQ